MENVTDRQLLEILRDQNKTREFFSQKANLTTLIESETQRTRLAGLIVGAGLDLASIGETLQSLSGGRVALHAPR
jgi:hypothetical protein